ncbi:MAG: hypothetical protein H7Z76_13855 [Methylotenera sp.]|nr:hypothetical protein [Flavobacterium sp.]
MFNVRSYASEEFALPEVILIQVVNDTEYRNIYILERGVQSTRTMKEFSEKDVKFIIRAKENRKHDEIKSLVETNQNLDVGDNVLVKDCIIILYQRKKDISSSEKEKLSLWLKNKFKTENLEIYKRE